MKIIRQSLLAMVVVLSVILLLTSCGGGGGGDDSLPTSISLDTTALGLTSVRLSWSAASTVTSYSVYMNGEYLGLSYPPGTSVTITTLTPDTRYCFRVLAVVFPIGAVAQSNQACVTTPPSIRPSMPTNLSASAVSPGEIDLAWTPSTGDFSGYKIYRDGTYLVSTAADSYADMSVMSSTQYCYEVSAYDQWGYESPKSSTACATTPADAEAPSIPTNLKAIYDPQSVANPTINLSWQAAYDNSGTVPAYRVYRDGAFLAQVSGLEYSDAGLGTSQQYCYAVAALDYTNNESVPSSPECVTTSWVSKTLDSSVHAQWTAIDVDGGDNLHIAYYDGQYTGSNQQAGTVKYATNLSGAWQSVAIDSVAPTVYGSIALLVNNDASLNAAYYDFNRYLLKRAVKTAGAWLTETIATNLLNVTTVAMAHDASNKLHLVINPNGNITYMSNATDSWTSEVIGNNGVIYGNAATCAIAVDNDGKAFVGYYDYANRILKYVSNKSGAWITETVDAIADAGLYTAIALDAAGNAHLSYYDVTNGDLKYATNATGFWVVQTIDSVGDVGQSSAIALDANGRVHISYTDASNHALKYATNASGSWMTYVIDNAAYVAGNLSSPGAYTSLAVDSSGKIHISYRGDGFLRYATNR